MIDAHDQAHADEVVHSLLIEALGNILTAQETGNWLPVDRARKTIAGALVVIEMARDARDAAQ